MGKGLDGCSCCYKMLSFLLFLLFLAGVAALIIWLLVRPEDFKSNVDSANLRTFSLNGSRLSYELDVAVSIRNPSQRMGVYYDNVDASASYDGHIFSHDKLAPFYQEAKNTTTLNASFAGEADLGDADVPPVTGESLRLNVRVISKVRFKVWSIKIGRCSSKIHCVLELPLPPPSSPSPTKCSVDISLNL